MIFGWKKQAGNFYSFTPANLVHNHPQGFFLTLISWIKGDHTPTNMVTTNFEDNSDPTTLFHNRKFCSYVIP